MTTAAVFASWVIGSCVSAEFLGYWLHRLLHSGAIGFLSRNHMRHHMVIYGPTQVLRSKQYHDATLQSFSLGNIGTEWLTPAGLLIGCAWLAFRLLGMPIRYQLVFFVTTLAWSFLMFSYLHDRMHIEDFWLERNRVLKRWFVSARHLHDTHHRAINDEGLMHKNFGIGFFLFDRLFGTLLEEEREFNNGGFQAAQRRFKSVPQAPSHATCDTNGR
jgi:sterol desaturase/sphingolipid hydroxylase (fatty acid hydroxylase superfamily)